jgi:hypothetical protein
MFVDARCDLKGFNNFVLHCRFMKAVAEILHSKYNDDIPNSMEGLVALPGVGPKMGHLCMQAAWNKCEDSCDESPFGADFGPDPLVLASMCTYTASPIDWVGSKPKLRKKLARCEHVRFAHVLCAHTSQHQALEGWLPHDLWAPINPLLVGFGQTVCRPVGPLCHECKAAAFCPAAPRTVRMAARKLVSLESGGPVAEALLADEQSETELEHNPTLAVARGLKRPEEPGLCEPDSKRVQLDTTVKPEPVWDSAVALPAPPPSSAVRTLRSRTASVLEEGDMGSASAGRKRGLAGLRRTAVSAGTMVKTEVDLEDLAG